MLALIFAPPPCFCASAGSPLRRCGRSLYATSRRAESRSAKVAEFTEGAWSVEEQLSRASERYTADGGTEVCDLRFAVHPRSRAVGPFSPSFSALTAGSGETASARAPEVD